VIVAVAGEFDLVSANAVREALTLVVSEQSRRVIVDLGDVTFMDSSGVHVILEAYTVSRSAGSTLTIRPGPRNVQRVFELTNLTVYFPFEIGP
jgi:anti-sigma B factor antagonist